MLIFKWMELENIGLFVGKQRIDFTKLGDLVQIDGINNNTGGSSGSAKTTVFNAADFLLGLNDKPTTVLQSRFTKEHIKVTGGFDWDGKDLVITRGKKLSISIDGNVTTGSSKLTEELLDTIIGMSRDIFRKMLHKRQKEGGFFLALTPSETYKFLVDCTGLNDDAKKIEKLDIKIKEITAKRDTATNTLDNTTSALNATQDALLALGAPPKAEVDQASILRLKTQDDQNASQLFQVQVKHREESSALDWQRPPITMAPVDSSTTDTLEKQLKDIRLRMQEIKDERHTNTLVVTNHLNKLKLQIAKIISDMSARDSAKIEVLKVAKDIKKIKASICPTCEQNWITESAKLKEAILMIEIGKYKDIIARGNESEKINDDLFAKQDGLSNALLFSTLPSIELDKLVRQESVILQELTKLRTLENDRKNAEHYLNQTKLKVFSDQQKELMTRHLVESDQIRERAEISRRDFDRAVFSLKSYSQALAKYETSLKTLKSHEEYYSTTISTAKTQYYQYRKELLIAEESKRAIKSYVSCSFKDALSAIGDTATRIIRNLPNMSNATIRLEGTRETKDGKIKEEVTAILDNEGEEGVDLRSLCGGEESATDLAIDLAVIDFVEHKANKGINLFILDEPFTGMDSTIIEQALEVLKNANINKRLILVDHNETVKEMVDSRIVVVRTGASSQIQQ